MGKLVGSSPMTDDRLVNDLISALVARGYKLVRDERFPQRFDDRAVELSGKDVLIGIDSDRGDDWLIAIGRSRKDWYSVSLWDDFIHGREPTDEALTLARQAAMLLSNLTAIEALMEPPTGDETLRSLLELAVGLADTRWPGFREDFNTNLRNRDAS